MAKKKKNITVLEDSRVIAKKVEEAEHWADRNSKIIFGLLAFIATILSGYLGFRYYLNKQEGLAQQEMFQAVYYFEADSLSLALEGDGNNLGFSQIIYEYGMTDAATLASYYAGVISLKQRDFSSAIAYLNDFSPDDILLQSRTYSLIGDAHMELEEYDVAATYYRKASSHKPNKFFTPTYMLKEALALEKINQYGSAIEVYQEIIDQYWDSEESSRAKKFKARLHADS